MPEQSLVCSQGRTFCCICPIIRRDTKIPFLMGPVLVEGKQREKGEREG